ncbi:SGNH/GDSL hydrolase family protein [bacterium]|nr:SGNH/GDSL hydrolase family protein [bacterium]
MAQFKYTAVPAALVAAAAFLWYGFLFPDPYLLARYPISRMLLWAARLGIPVLTLLALVLAAALVKGRIRRSDLFLLAGTCILILVFAVTAGSVFYNRTFQNSRNNRLYHPYLQLAPPGPPDWSGKTGSLRIACLGGSTTEFKDDSGRGWPERLEQILRERLGTDSVSVFNGGRQWYTTLHTLINYQSHIRPVKPDVIIIMHTINDLLHNADFCYFSRGPFRQDYGHFTGPVSRIIDRQGFAAFLWKTTAGLWHHKPRAIISQKDFPGLASFRRNLNAIIDWAERDGTAVFLLTQPNLYKPEMTQEEQKSLYMLNTEAVGPSFQWSAETVCLGFTLYRETLERIAEERSVPLIDVEKEIPKSLDYFTDDVHYTMEAFDRVAGCVASGLTESRVLESRRPVSLKTAATGIADSANP